MWKVNDMTTGLKISSYNSIATGSFRKPWRKHMNGSACSKIQWPHLDEKNLQFNRSDAKSNQNRRHQISQLLSNEYVRIKLSKQIRVHTFTNTRRSTRDLSMWRKYLVFDFEKSKLFATSCVLGMGEGKVAQASGYEEPNYYQQILSISDLFNGFIMQARDIATRARKIIMNMSPHVGKMRFLDGCCFGAISRKEAI